MLEQPDVSVLGRDAVILDFIQMTTGCMAGCRMSKPVMSHVSLNVISHFAGGNFLVA